MGPAPRKADGFSDLGGDFSFWMCEFILLFWILGKWFSALDQGRFSFLQDSFFYKQYFLIELHLSEYSFYFDFLFDSATEPKNKEIAHYYFRHFQLLIASYHIYFSN
jgi:hypothetical protein